MNQLNTAYRVRLLLMKTKATTVPMFDRSCKDYGTRCVLLPQLLVKTAVSAPRLAVCSQYMHTSRELQGKGGYLEWILGKFGIKVDKYVVILRGTMLYDSVVDNLNYSKFYKEFNMADTFFSWFLVTELHVWLLICRIMAEKRDGRELRHSIVNRMWEDVNARVKLMGPINVSVKRKQLNEISQQFNAAIIDYDEGIMSDDKVLAGALWRTFFFSECNNPEHVEKLIMYVRKQISNLDKRSLEELSRGPCIKELDIKIDR